MTNRRFSRSEILVGAGAVTIAGLTACDRTASPLLPGSTNPSEYGSQFKVGLPAVVVSTPTGSAIQKAIDSLPASGGTVQLTASQPYVIKKALVINKLGNVTLIGRGPAATVLQAASGANLAAPGQNAECVLSITASLNITVQALSINNASENNDGSNPRYGIGVWNTKGLTVDSVTYQANLGPNAANQSLSVNSSSGVLVTGNRALTSRTGLAFSKVTKLRVLNSLVQNCKGLAKGSSAGIWIADSTTGVVSGCYVTRNNYDAGIYVTDSVDVKITTNRVTINDGVGMAGCDGISLNNVKGPLYLRRTLLTMNTGSGIALAGCTTISIKTCTMTNNGSKTVSGTGVSLRGGNSGISVGTCKVLNERRAAPSGSVGIAIGYSSTADTNCKIMSNSIHGWSTGVGLGSSSSNITVEYNDLRKNATCYVDNGSGNQVGDNLC